MFHVALSTTLLVVFSTAFGQEGENVEVLEKQLPPLEVPFDLGEYIVNPNAAQAHANNVVVYVDWDGPPLTNGLSPGFKVIDGDIVVPEEFDGQTAAAYATNLWPGGVIPYGFDANVTGANAAAMLVAMSWWENVAAVDFIPRADQFNYLLIRNNAFNNSPVGIQGGAVAGQVINITSWNNTAIMAHELGHSMGFWHEQSRTDRDNFVIINTANVCQNCCQQGDGSMGSCNFNFQIESTSAAYGPYDFDSVMHYGACDFSMDPNCGNTCPGAGETVIVRPAFSAEWQCGNPPTDNTFIGQRTHLSAWDGRVMSFLYPRANWRFQSDSRGFFLFPGDFLLPFASFATGYDNTPPGGTLWILDPSTHAVGPVLDKRMTIGAPLGGVTLTR